MAHLDKISKESAVKLSSLFLLRTPGLAQLQAKRTQLLEALPSSSVFLF